MILGIILYTVNSRQVSSLHNFYDRSVLSNVDLLEDQEIPLEQTDNTATVID